MLQVQIIYRTHCPLCSVIKESSNKVIVEEFAKKHECTPGTISYSSPPACVIDSGHILYRTLATWSDRNKVLFYVCDGHKAEYDKRPDFGPFDWFRIAVE